MTPSRSLLDAARAALNYMRAQSPGSNEIEDRLEAACAAEPDSGKEGV